MTASAGAWLLVLLTVGPGLTGCTAVATRSVLAMGPEPATPVYFAGVRADYHIMADAKDREASWLWPGYCILDMPFSLGADLLLSPYDAYIDYRWSQRTNVLATSDPE